MMITFELSIKILIIGDSICESISKSNNESKLVYLDLLLGTIEVILYNYDIHHLSR